MFREKKKSQLSHEALSVLDRYVTLLYMYILTTPYKQIQIQHIFHHTYHHPHVSMSEKKSVLTYIRKWILRKHTHNQRNGNMHRR